MCTISSKLKLCTCKTQNVAALMHYWILKRPNQGTYWAIGEIFLPYNIGAAAHQLNQQTILTQLNKGNCFDTEIQHLENDLLELHFTVKADPAKGLEGGYLAYTFKFVKGKWEIDEYDPFNVNVDEVLNGKIVRPFA